jgi:hypothetical protein
MEIPVLGIDLGKNSCSVVGLDPAGRVVLRRRRSCVWPRTGSSWRNCAGASRQDGPKRSRSCRMVRRSDSRGPV